MNVIDKRAPRDYTPSCEFCNDEGCSVCEPTMAQRVAARLQDEEKRGIVGEAKAYLSSRGATNIAPNALVPFTGRDFVELIMGAIEHGVALERGRVARTPVQVATKSQRFDRLEIRE